MVLAMLAALVWAVGLPVAVALVQDYSTWSGSRQGEALAMPSWLADRDAHTPLPSEERFTGPFVQRIERRAEIEWRDGTYEAIYEEFRFGWPFKSVATGLIGARHIAGAPPAAPLEFVAVLDERMGWRKGLVVGSGAGGWPTVIPVMPKWGLLANALLVAMPIVMAATAWGVVVRRRRLDAGLCPMCGYEGAVALGSCGECGWNASVKQDAQQTPA